MSEEEQHHQQQNKADFESLPYNTSASLGVSVEAEALKFCYATSQYFGKPNTILGAKNIGLINQCMA